MSANKNGERRVFIMKLKPLEDRVVLKQQEAEEKTQSGIILPDSAKEKPQAAVVVAVGPGKIEDGHKVEMQVKEGDKVIYSKYSGTEVKYDGEEYIIVAQKDIIAIVE
jgi:chaperonin GroES